MVKNIIRLGKRKSKFATIGEQLKRRKDLPSFIRIPFQPSGLPTPIRFITSPTLTGALAGGLSLLLGGTLLGAAALGGGIPTVAGLFKASPRAERIAKEKLLQPEKFGERIGTFVEDPLKPFRDVKEKVIDILPKVPSIPDPVKKAAVIGAGAAAVVAAASAILPRVKEAVSKQLPEAQLPVIPTQAFEPLAPVQQVTPEKEKPVVLEEMIKQQPISIRNTFKPSIDISFKKTKRFINQQVIIK